MEELFLLFAFALTTFGIMHNLLADNYKVQISHPQSKCNWWRCTHLVKKIIGLSDLECRPRIFWERERGQIKGMIHISEFCSRSLFYTSIQTFIVSFFCQWLKTVSSWSQSFVDSQAFYGILILRLTRSLILIPTSRRFWHYLCVLLMAMSTG